VTFIKYPIDPIKIPAYLILEIIIKNLSLIKKS